MRRQWIFIACLAVSPLLAGDDGAKFGAAPLRLSDMNASKTSVLKGRKLEQILASSKSVDPKMEITEDNASRTLTAIVMSYDALGNETGEVARTFKATGYELLGSMDSKVTAVIVRFKDHLKNTFWLDFRFNSVEAEQAFVANLNQLQSYHLRMGYRVYYRCGSTGESSHTYGAHIVDGEDVVGWQGPL